MSKADQLLVVVTEHGPLRMNELNQRMKITWAPALVKGLVKAGKLKTSDEKRNALVGLPSQDLAAPPPDQKTRSPKKTKGKRKKKQARAKRAAASPAAAFTAALTVNSALVLIDGDRPARIHTAEETEAIATLLLNHFK